MKIIVVAFLLAASALADPDDWIWTQNDESLDEFNSEFNIVDLTSDEEKQLESERLKEVEAEVNKQNAKYAEGKASFGERLYPFSDWSKEEFEEAKEGMLSREWDPSRGDAPPERRSMGMVIPPESERNTPENQVNLNRMYKGLEGRALPRSYTNPRLVTTPKNQGNCGSCVAFAAHGLHEVCMVKAGAPKKGLDLSEQYLVDCGYDGKQMNGCKGAAPHRYTAFFWEKGGQGPHEASYPYLDKYPHLNCKAASKVPTWNSGAKVSQVSWDYNCNEAKLMQMVFQYGAVVAGVYASDDAFIDYDGRGVFNKCSRNKRSNHAVLVVGWGEEKGQKYWLIKNSWGFGWGAFGYLKLLRGANECNIGDVCVVADCQATGRPDTAPATTPAPQIPVNLWCDMTKAFGNANSNGYFDVRSGDKSNPGKIITVNVKCRNSFCTPTMPGPTNACMYICGGLSC